MSVIATPLNDFLWWTQAEYGARRLVVTADAPEDQVRFAQDWGEWCEVLGLPRVIFEDAAPR